MVFSSIIFLFYFLPIFLAAYFLAPSINAKNIIALFFSLLFYAWGEPSFILLLLVSIAFNMGAALYIDRREGRQRLTALSAAIAINIGVLVYFKYKGFVLANLSALLQPWTGEPSVTHLHLPLGISFFTFHCLSYLIDVYRRRFPAERNPVIVALYITLFPQLVAGPIVRYKTIARQFHKRRHTIGRASAGARIFVIGLAQKALIADQVAPLVDAVFDRTPLPSMAESWIGLLAYSIQIYFDFTGYSNMACGLGVCLGFTLPRNFNVPYASLSITEFWRRWHISLSAWLRDYLYIPLGGSRGAQWQTYRNLVTVFLLCGLWHGASWTFVVWGLWHGLFLVFERTGMLRNLRYLPPAARWLYTILVVMGGWVLFRAADIASAGKIYSGLLGFNSGAMLGLDIRADLQPTVYVALVVGALLAVFPRWWELKRRSQPSWSVADAIWTFAMLLFAIIWVGAGTYSPFLYFRF